MISALLPVALLLSSQTGDPGRRRATQREQVRHTVDSKGESQLAASPDFTGPVGQPRPATDTLTLSKGATTAAVPAGGLRSAKFGSVPAF